MYILGMTGPIGHGKTTLASALQKLEPSTVHFESSMIVAEVANALQSKLTEIPDPYNVDELNDWLKYLPEILFKIVHIKTSFDKIKLNRQAMEAHPIEFQKLILHVENLKRKPAMLKQIIDKENKETFRPILQWLGGYLVQHVDKGIWYNEIVRRIQEVAKKGCQLCIVGGLRFPTDAVILRSTGAVIVQVYRPAHLQGDLMDPTEREREDIHADCVVMSNGTLEDVHAFAPLFYEDLKKNTLKKLYQTKI